MNKSKQTVEKGTVRWYQADWFTLLTLLFIPPISIILVWKNPRYKKKLKIGLTLIALFLTVAYYSNYKGEQVTDSAREDRHSIYLPQYEGETKCGINFLYNEGVSTKKVSQVFEEVKDAIVIIRTYNDKGEEDGEGTGFFFDKNGFIVTNYHILAGAHRIEIILTNGEKSWNASIVKSDDKKDIAIIKTDLLPSQVLFIDNSESMPIGEEIITIGNPLGYELSVSTGIISAFRNDNEGKFIQITAPVSPGNSGGPLISKNGAVIGIVTSRVDNISAQNLNFAIPISYLIDLVK